MPASKPVITNSKNLSVAGPAEGNKLRLTPVLAWAVDQGIARPVTLEKLPAQWAVYSDDNPNQWWIPATGQTGNGSVTLMQAFKELD